MAETLQLGTERVPGHKGFVDKPVAFMLEASPVFPLVCSAASTSQPLKSDVPIAGVPEHPLKGSDGPGVRAEPFECVPDATHRAPQGVKRMNVVRAASQAATSS